MYSENDYRIYSSELYHHGIKGQKWGIRRYQNSDGSLTVEGRKRYLAPITEHNVKRRYTNADGSLTKEGREAILQLRETYKNYKVNQRIRDGWNPEDIVTLRSKDNHDALSNVGVRYKNDNEDVIVKGSKAYRVTDKDESVDKNRKYMSITKDDEDTYKSMYDYFVDDYINTRFDEYEFSKDARVANGKKVVNDILDMYGDKNLKDSFIELNYRELKDLKKMVETTDSSVGDKFLAELAYNGGNKINYILSQKMFKDQKTSGEIFENFRKQGYDAIVDAEDYYAFGEVQYPIIVLTPQDSVKRTKSTYI